MGSELEENAWNSCMAMLVKLGEVFPYFPMPNYPWAHMTGNVICTMCRECSIYMEGITGVLESEGDVEMESVQEEDVVPADLPVEVETERRYIMLAETVS